MTDWVEDVLAFHRRFHAYVGSAPSFPDADTLELRCRLVRDELEELVAALHAQDLVEVADAIADTIYTLIGLGIACGIDLRPVWREVQRTNMLKESDGPGRKVRKPAGWQAPDIAGALRAP